MNQLHTIFLMINGVMFVGSHCNTPVAADNLDPRVQLYCRDNETLPFIDEKAFQQCYYDIRGYINLEALIPYLVKYQLLSANDEKYLTNSIILHSEKCNYLADIAGRNKRNGYMLLYMCFLESLAMARSHVDVVEKLDKGMKKTISFMLSDKSL